MIHNDWSFAVRAYFFVTGNVPKLSMGESLRIVLFVQKLLPDQCGAPSWFLINHGMDIHER
jgi:hypothetical protein